MSLLYIVSANLLSGFGSAIFDVPVCGNDSRSKDTHSSRRTYMYVHLIGNRLFNVQTIRVIKIENKKLGG